MTSPIVLNHSQLSDADLLRHRENIATARKQIKGALITTLLIGGISTISGLAQISRGVPDSGWNILDVVLIFGLSYGIYRNNALCAKLIFGYYLISKLIQVFSGHFPPLAAPIAGIVFYYLWQGMVGTSSYQRLMQAEQDLTQLQSVATEPDRGRSPEQNRTVATPSQPLNPTPELLALCGGDRAQAQWLLSQIKMKHPDRSPGWYDRRAIEQLTTKTPDRADDSDLDRD